MLRRGPDRCLPEHPQRRIPAKAQRRIDPFEKPSTTQHLQDGIGRSQRIDCPDSIAAPIDGIAVIHDHAPINRVAALCIVLNKFRCVPSINQLDRPDRIFQPRKCDIRPAERTFAIIDDFNRLFLTHDIKRARCVSAQRARLSIRKRLRLRSVEHPHQADAEIVHALIAAIAENLTM